MIKVSQEMFKVLTSIVHLSETNDYIYIEEELRLYSVRADFRREALSYLTYHYSISIIC